MYDRAGEDHNELVALFHKKSMSTNEKAQLNNVLGLHVQFLLECGKIIGVTE